MKLIILFILFYSINIAEDQFSGLTIDNSIRSDGVSVSLDNNDNPNDIPVLFDISSKTEASISAYRWVHKSVVTKNTDYVSIKSSANLRKIPSLKSKERPFNLRSSESFKILAKDGDWYKIDLSESQKSLGIAVFKIAIINTNSGSLALRPKLKNSSRSQYKWLSKGTKIQILEVQGNWALIKYDSTIGFSSKKYLKETGDEEEYWHEKSNSRKKGLLSKIETLGAKFKMNEASSEDVFEYVQTINSYLEYADLKELNSAILEMKRQTELLIQKKSPSSEDKKYIVMIKDFKSKHLTSISEDLDKASNSLENNNLDKALLYAKIATYKSDYSNTSSLSILAKVLDEKSKKENNTSQKQAYVQEKLFIEKLIAENNNEETSTRSPASNENKSENKEEPIDTPGVLSEEDKIIDEKIELVLNENKKNYLTKGKNRLEKLDSAIGGKSAKLKYYLAKQYVFLARAYKSKSQSLKSKAKTLLLVSKSLKNKNLDTYTENNLWAEKAEKLLDEGFKTVEEAPVSVTNINTELQNLPGNKVKLSSYDLNALASIAVLEAGANCQKETLDVAQVIFNRINSRYFKNTIDQVVFRYKAFEPFGSVDGTSNKSKRSRIFNTRDKSLKYIADFRRGMDYKKAKTRVDIFINALKNTTKMKAARNFVGGRAFFLGSNQSYHPSRGDVTRDRRKCNHYKFGLYNDRELRTHKRVKDELVREAPVEVTGQ
ncbi:MAG: hypothetical protein COB02_06130 [Candidatus Cloacimonadota bacterium]|nr:MAG: hypothetical protein COB02_06130 [Candidatus Cloacimonadota bacterium]